MAESFAPDRTLDIRGQVCPLTLVRSKLALDKLAPGALLEILLDHPPAVASVPRSLESEGHAVLRVEQTGKSEWRLIVRKGRALGGSR